MAGWKDFPSKRPSNHLFLLKKRIFPKKYLVIRKIYVNLHREVHLSVGGR